MSPLARQQPEPARPRIGCQMVIFGVLRWPRELLQALDEVARAGYSGIEAGRLSDLMPLEQLHRELGARQLVQAGLHVGFGELANLKRLLAYCRALDIVHLQCSGVPDRERGLAAYREGGERFRRAALELRAHGVQFAYHPHTWEFQRLEDGRRGLDVLLEATDPGLVKLAPDVYWLSMAGEEPAEFLARHAERIGWLHFQDGTRREFSELGRGTLDWPAILAACRSLDLPWIIVEQARTNRLPVESLTVSREFLRARFAL